MESWTVGADAEPCRSCSRAARRRWERWEAWRGGEGVSWGFWGGGRWMGGLRWEMEIVKREVEMAWF